MTRPGGPVVLLIAALAGCAAVPPPTRTAAPETGRDVGLVDPATVLDDEWQHLPLVGRTAYDIAIHEGRLAVRARGRESASLLIRRIDIDLARCPALSWSWSVTRLQPSADLEDRAKEDVAAAIYVLFDDPGSVLDPQPVPTLRYVWTNARLPAGAIIDSPYMPGVVRSIVVRSGGRDLGLWVAEKRNLADDFARAFGTAPPARAHAVALFTDNDQTKEPVEAHYGPARALCRPKLS